MKKFAFHVNLVITAIIIATISAAFISSFAKAATTPARQLAPQQLNICFDATTQAAQQAIKSSQLANLHVDPLAQFIVRNISTLNPEGGLQHRTVQLVDFNDQTINYTLDIIVELSTCRAEFTNLKAADKF